MKEEWRDIEYFIGYYQVSNLGKIRSLDRKIGNRIYKGKVLSTKSINNVGYVIYMLRKGGTSKTVSGHRMVALAFLDNPDNKPQVNHIDADPSNNNVSNLEWATSKENTNHAHAMGLCKPTFGERHHWAKLSSKQGIEIRNLCSAGEIRQYEIANMYKVSDATISSIKNNTRRKKG